MDDVGLLIEGRASAAAGGATFERISPISGKPVTRAAAGRKADALAAVEAAAAAFPSWSKTGPNARRALLWKAADLIAARAGDFARLMTQETGSTTGWGMFNAHLGAGLVREAAAMTTQITGEIVPSDKPGTLALAMRVPAGVCVGIAPWNAPVILGLRAIAMPIACGNTAILKASEACPATHRLIGEIFHEAGLPPGVLNVVTNAPEHAAEVVEALVIHPKVRRVNFTGSTRVGRIIGEMAGRNLKPALLELGGKAPLIVLDDADLDAAVDAAAFSAFMHSGQICMSAERVIVHDKIADAFVEKFRAKAAKITSGDPALGQHILGSVVSRDAMAHVEQLLADAKAKGGAIVCGGVASDAFMDATIVDHVTPEMKIYSEESFGPSVSVVRARDDEDAIRIANDTDYGLSAAVFSATSTAPIGVAQRIESGICHINGPTVQDEPQMPFGGVKSSGYGRFGGKSGVAEFTDTRWITIENGQHYPF